MPRLELFYQAESFFDQHVDVGEKYIEYVKCTCEHLGWTFMLQGAKTLSRLRK